VWVDGKRSGEDRYGVTDEINSLEKLQVNFRIIGDFFLDVLNLEGGTDTLSRNVGKGLPLDAA
jgi:hypothetical protein